MIEQFKKERVKRITQNIAIINNTNIRLCGQASTPLFDSFATILIDKENKSIIIKPKGDNIFSWKINKIGQMMGCKLRDGIEKDIYPLEQYEDGIIIKNVRFIEDAKSTLVAALINEYETKNNKPEELTQNRIDQLNILTGAPEQ